jgi:hypothetical protein
VSSDAQTRALYVYLKLRARRDRLALHPTPDGEKFTPAEVEQMAAAETVLNRLRGAAAIELLISHRSSVLGFIAK